MIFAVGVGYMVREFSSIDIPEFLPGPGEAILFLVAAFAAMGFALARLTGLLSDARVASLPEESIRSSILRQKGRHRLPRFVAIGGGTGLATMLRGLKEKSRLTGIVTVADDGGSSGRLREELGLPAPGDIRNCIVALADTEPLMKDLFQYRFPNGGPLEGHSFGNLFIVAMTEITNSFEQALYESSKVLAVHGEVAPSTMADLSLSARLKNGDIVNGESLITERGGEIDQLFIEPANAQASPRAMEAIRQAQMIVIGPGSLYTSILPNLLVRGIAEAMRHSAAPKIYVCNVATQKGETEGYAVEDHIEALQRHTFETVADYVVANDNPIELGTRFLGKPVVSDGRPIKHAKLKLDDLTDPNHPVRHDSANLARIIMDVYHNNGGRKAKAPFKLAVKA
ncbi:MAG: YvcK family protein [Chloroflexi bacterium]|nr:YvcK family protein [Chloroflexota bacterium]